MGKMGVSPEKQRRNGDLSKIYISILWETWDL